MVCSRTRKLLVFLIRKGCTLGTHTACNTRSEIYMYINVHIFPYAYISAYIPGLN